MQSSTHAPILKGARGKLLTILPFSYYLLICYYELRCFEVDKMATNTKISDKPPIAPKSQALKLLAEEKRKRRPLQFRYVHSMRMRFEKISNSTGNVNFVSYIILAKVSEASFFCLFIPTRFAHGFTLRDFLRLSHGQKSLQSLIFQHCERSEQLSFT